MHCWLRMLSWLRQPTGQWTVSKWILLVRTEPVVNLALHHPWPSCLLTFIFDVLCVHAVHRGHYRLLAQKPTTAPELETCSRRCARQDTTMIKPGAIDASRDFRSIAPNINSNRCTGGEILTHQCPKSLLRGLLLCCGLFKKMGAHALA